jgi:hypothetical protein
VTVATITPEPVAKGGVKASDLLREGAASGQAWLINDRMYDREALVRQMQGMAGRGQDDALCELGAQCWTNKALFPAGDEPCGRGRQWCNFALTTGTEAALLAGAAAGPARSGAAANTAGRVGSTLARSDLNPSQLANLTRYTKKLPSGAEETIIMRGANGTVEFTTRSRSGLVRDLYEDSG